MRRKSQKRTKGTNRVTYAMATSGTFGSYGERVNFISSSEKLSIEWFTVAPRVEDCAGIFISPARGPTLGYTGRDKSFVNGLAIFGWRGEDNSVRPVWYARLCMAVFNIMHTSTPNQPLFYSLGKRGCAHGRGEDKRPIRISRCEDGSFDGNFRNRKVRP